MSTKIMAIKQFGFLSMLALIMLALFPAVALADPPDPGSDDEGVQPSAPACTTSDGSALKPPWFIYGNSASQMHVLIETDTDVDNDSNHMKIEFTQSGVHCSRDYHKMDIKEMDDRRLWTFSCSGFQPNKHYSYEIYFRDWYSSVIDYCWKSYHGWFLTPPNDHTASKLSFYGYGDTRTYTQDITNDDPINQVAHAMVQHHNNHENAGAFVIHTGDIVPNGGKVAHWEKNDRGLPVIIDPWTEQFFLREQRMQDMLAQLPIFTTIGNHDFSCDAGKGDCSADGANPYYYYRYFQYPMYGAHGGDNHGYYRIGWDINSTDATIGSWTEPFLVPGWFGGWTAGGGVSVADLNGNAIPDLVAFHIDNPSGENHGYYRIGWDVHKDTGQASSWTDPIQIPGWYGGDNNGGGIAVADINGNTKPDLVAYHVDNPEDPDHDYYRIGWDVDPNTGEADSWTDPIGAGSISDSRLGGGVAVTDINDNGVADLVVSYVFNYSNGATRMHYRIGWDLNSATGHATKWSAPLHVPGSLGDFSEGAGIAVADINDNQIPDLVALQQMAFDNENPGAGYHTYYSIGWDLDGTTGAASSWKDPQQIPDAFGRIAAGGGIAIGDINGKGGPDLIAYHVDDRRGDFHSGDLWDYYYEFWWGPAIVFSLTTYPMDGYCTYSDPVGPGAEQYDWLRTSLQQTAHDKRPWKIVFMHAPPYDADASCNQAQIRKYWIPLFEKYGVDLVISGHEHYYARKEVNGIQYLVLGGGGASLSNVGHPDDVDFSAKKYGFNYFEIDGDTMTITALDENGNEFDRITIDKSPVADFTFSQDPASAPLVVQFQDNSAGHVSGWQWDFGDGKTSSAQNPTHMYAEPGTYDVALTVHSPWNSSTMTHSVKAALNAGFLADPIAGPLPLAVSFTPAKAYSYSHWDFGDGAELQQPGTVSHTYESNGKFTVTHTTGDDADHTSTSTKHDYIKVEPYADFACQSGFWDCGGGIFPQFCPAIDCTNHSGGDALTFLWDFGDGNTSTEENPSHLYGQDAGNPLIMLTVTDINGLTDSQSRHLGNLEVVEPVRLYLPLVND